MYAFCFARAAVLLRLVPKSWQHERFQHPIAVVSCGAGAANVGDDGWILYSLYRAAVHYTTCVYAANWILASAYADEPELYVWCAIAGCTLLRFPSYCSTYATYYGRGHRIHGEFYGNFGSILKYGFIEERFDFESGKYTQSEFGFIFEHDSTDGTC